MKKNGICLKIYSNINNKRIGIPPSFISKILREIFESEISLVPKIQIDGRLI